jgi:hypothetical protein
LLSYGPPPSNELVLKAYRQRRSLAATPSRLSSSLSYRWSALRIAHDADKTAAHTNYLDDKRTKEIKRSKEIIDLHARLSMEQEPQPKKRPFKEILRERTAHIKPPALDQGRERGREREL